MIYLDNAATTPLLPEARAAMLAAMDLPLGNASALHSAGHQAYQLVEEARAAVASLINAQPAEIIFTSGGSEANNTVMETFRGQNVATSSIEHPSILEAAKARAANLTLLPVDQFGHVCPADCAAAADKINLLSVMLANNELGTIQPIKEISQAAKRQNPQLFLHSDATQALGKIPLDVQKLGVDYLTLSAHKIGGPIGVGALYVRSGAPFTSLIKGGHQEAGRRAGTINTLGIVGFGAAARWCREQHSGQKWQRVAQLRDQLRDRILESVPYSSCNSPADDCLPNLLNMSFQAAEGESIQLYLDIAGVAVGTGSACAAGDLQPSHVLMASRGDAEVAHSSIRFSLGLDTTPADLDAVLAALPGIIQRLQGISTVQIKTTN